MAKKKHKGKWERTSVWNKRHLIRKYGGKCALCGVQVTLKKGKPNMATIDHIIPKSKGGLNKFNNYQLLCYECNQWKGNKIIECPRPTGKSSKQENQ